MTLANDDESGLERAGRSPGNSVTDLHDPPRIKAGRAETTRRASRTFGSLRTRNYRLFATGQVISNTGSWMQRVAQDWLVLDLTHNSGTALGITIGLQFLPMVFSMWGGVIADHHRDSVGRAARAV